MVFLLDFVVDLAEERVDLGGSQFPESILERWYSAHASQQNVVSWNSEVHVHLVQHCLLMTQIVTINNGSHRSFTKCFISNVECFAFMTRTCLRTIWHIFCVCFNNIDLLRTGRFSSILHSSRATLNNGSSRSLTAWIQKMVGSIGNF